MAVALHLLKACHYWTDTAQGEFDLHFVRDKEQREVDFLGNPRCFQLVDKPGHDRAFPAHNLRVLHHEKLLAGLV